MSITSSLTVKPLLWACGILLLACGLLATRMAITDAQHTTALTAETARADAAEILASNRMLGINSLKHANQTQQEVTQDLQRRLSDAVGKAQQTQQALADAEAQRDAARKARDQTQAQLRAAMEKSYANDPNCAAWGRTAVCAGVSDGMFEAWTTAGSAAGR